MLCFVVAPATPTFVRNSRLVLLQIAALSYRALLARLPCDRRLRDRE